MSELAERTPNDRNAGEIVEAEKVQFLDLIRHGLDRSEAARKLGFLGRHFRALCSPKSPFYDEDFAKEYGEAISSLEYETNRLERLRAEATRRALIDSDRLLEKLLMVYDPDWEILRTTKTESNINVQLFVRQTFKQLPTEKLEQILAWVEEVERNTIEGTARELPPAVKDDDAREAA